MTVLNPAPGFEVDIDDWAPATTAILGKKRTGKSNAATVIAEEMWDAGAHWVLIDPKGDAWGMRKAADGDGPGLPVPIFGGLHADLPLDETMGDFIADLVYDQQLTCILDISRFESKAARARFLTTFAKRIYRRHQEGKRVLNIILDEAHQVVPEVGRADEGMVASIGAWTDVVAMGGSLGLGVTLISQRSASIAKSVLSQIEVLIILRTASKLDRDAIKGWLEHQEVSADVQTSMHRLANGEAWVVSGYLNLGARVTFRMRRTFDSAATPKVGEKTKRVTLDDLDVAGIKSAMGDLAEKVTDDDPKRLRARIAKLEKDLAARPATVTEVIVDRPYIPREVTDLLDRAKESAEAFAREALDLKALTPDVPTPSAQPSRPVPPRAPSARTAPPPREAQPGTPADTSLGGMPGTVMATLHRYHPEPLALGRLAALCGTTLKKTTLRNALTKLRGMGYVHNVGTGIGLTPAGVEATSGLPPLPTGPELLAHWRSAIGGGAPLAVFDYLLDQAPAHPSRDDIHAHTGYDPATTTVRNAITKLRNLGVLVGDHINPDLLESIS